jgi:hypothetical protein
MEAKDLPCGTCIYWRPLKLISCKAFPQGIPDRIISGTNRHTKKLKEQVNDYLYTAVDWAGNPELRPYMDPRFLEI